MSRVLNLKKHFCRLLASAKQAPSQLTPHSAKPESSVFRTSPSHPPSQGFNEGLLRAAINGDLCRRAVAARGSLLQQGRFYHVDARGYQHFQRKGFGGPHGKNRIRLYSLIFISIGGIFVLVYTTHQEVVPYTLRRHFVFISPELEARLVDQQFDAMKKQWKTKILPPIHPQAVRVRKIAKDVIQAVMEGTKLDNDAQLLEEGNNKEKVEWGDHIDTPVSEQWEGQNEVLDEQWADQSRKKGLKEGAKPFVDHLKPAKWEVIVVDEDVANAMCLPGGKIVIFTGLIKRFPSDAEIATALSHEVAHVVARHGAEKLTHNFFVLLFELVVLTFFYAPDLVRGAATLFLELPFSRSQELEADHIGLLLMAAAGYDPRGAPDFYEKLGKLGGASEMVQYVTTHPSGSKRGENLRKTGTMEQAVNIYMEKTQGKTVEGFL